MSEVQVHHWNTEIDGPLNEENMTKKINSQGFSCAKYTFPIGTAFPNHTHDVLKKDGILAGQFKFATSENEFILQAGDILDIPVGLMHNESVVGSDEVIFFDATKISSDNA